MRKFTPIAELLRRAESMALSPRAKYLALQIRIEQGEIDGKRAIHRTSVRIRELEIALERVQRRRLKREKAA